MYSKNLDVDPALFPKKTIDTISSIDRMQFFPQSGKSLFLQELTLSVRQNEKSSSKISFANIYALYMDYIISRDGSKIAYAVNGTGYPIFIFNGFTCSKHNIKHLVSKLATRYKVIYWDYKGHGDSSTPKVYQDATVEGSIDDAKKVLEKLKIKKAIFLGYSTGVQIMLEFNFQYPNIATGLILISGFSGKVFDSFLNTNIFSYVGEGLKQLSPMMSGAFEQTWKVIHKLPFILRLFIASKIFLNEDKTNPEDVQPFLDSLADQDMNLLLHFIMDVHNHSLSSELETISLPTLILCGEKDLFAPQIRSEEMHHKILNSTLKVIAKASHNIVLEEPEKLSEDIFQFLEDKLMEPNNQK